LEKFYENFENNKIENKNDDIILKIIIGVVVLIIIIIITVYFIYFKKQKYKINKNSINHQLYNSKFNQL